LEKRRPGEVRDAIMEVLADKANGASVEQISAEVVELIGDVSASSVRSYLRINTPQLFARMDRGQYALQGFEPAPAVVPFAVQPAVPSTVASAVASAPPASARQSKRTERTEAAQVHHFGKACLYRDDCNAWLDRQADNSIHAVLTDPPYSTLEYSESEQQKLRAGKGGVWRIPPSFDGVKRSPLPRFTVLKSDDLRALDEFFAAWGRRLMRVLVPGANVLVASNPLVSHRVACALERSGLERRGEIIRLVMTMRGGDRPKHAHQEFDDVSVMPRSMWEPWLMFRKPIEGRVQDNLRRWGTGGFRRIGAEKPFGDVIASAPTRASERKLADHPSLKPQAFLRQLARGILPLGTGTILDPFAGSGSTLAAAQAVGHHCIGVERDERYFKLAVQAVPRLTDMKLAAANSQ